MEAKDFLACMQKEEVPPSSINGLVPRGRSCFNIYDWEYGKYLFSIRKRVREMGMYALVDKEWTADLAKWIGERKCLEIQAGIGWLAKALSEHGVKIEATDDFSWGFMKKVPPVFPVKKMDRLDAIKNIDAEILIISWPHFDDAGLVDVCQAWGKERYVIYIGEDCGGCCAPEEFFEWFNADEEAPDFCMPSWEALHDSVSIGFFKKGDGNESD